MFKMIQLRHVPDPLHRRLKARTALEGHTLSDYLRQEAEPAAEPPTIAELRERLRRPRVSRRFARRCGASRARAPVMVVDASVVLELLLVNPAAISVEKRLFADGQSLHAPHLLDLEVAQVLRQYFFLAGRLTTRRGSIALEYLSGPLTRYPHKVLLPRIWDFATTSLGTGLSLRRRGLHYLHEIARSHPSPAIRPGCSSMGCLSARLPSSILFTDLVPSLDSCRWISWSRKNHTAAGRRGQTSGGWQAGWHHSERSGR